MKRYWKDLVPAGNAYHISAALDERRMPIALHHHDFAEVLWVTEGYGLHRVNGSRVEMFQGDMAFIRPEDCHSLSACADSRFRLENVAFPRRALQRFQRACADSGRDWFWRNGTMPLMLKLNAEQRNLLAAEIAWLRNTQRDRLGLETFLLNLLRLLGAKEAHMDDLPDWLRSAMIRFRSPEDLPGGAQRLRELAGRCPEHLARTMQRFCGMTPSTWVNARRLDHAARLLESSPLPIIEVAATCGFDNLSHFHRLFRQRYGVTPLRHRIRQHTIM